MPELLSLVLTLKPLKLPADPASLPRWWGRAAHALLLDLLREKDEHLSAQMHDGPESDINKGSSGNLVRPFTTSTLMGRFPDHNLGLEERYALRLSAFRADVAGILAQACESGGPTPGRLAAGQTIELDYLPFLVERHSLQAGAEPGPYAQRSSYQEISAPYLLAKVPAPRRISLMFSSPTPFKSGGRHVPLPLPGLVFGSLLERWNSCAPLAFPPEARRYAEECLAISQYHLQTRPVPQKSAGLRMGAIGRVTFSTLNYDRYWMSVLAVLAQFSLFSGLGVGTSQGLGQCRRLPEREAREQA